MPCPECGGTAVIKHKCDCVLKPPPPARRPGELTPLHYTQHTVAFPTLPIYDRSVRDSITVSLTPDGGGTLGEMEWEFMHFPTGHRAVKMHCFGDGLPCLYDERVQQVMEAWRSLPDPDVITTTGLIALLDHVGAVPSQYHSRGER